MDPLELAQIGTTDLKVTRLGMGSAPLGGLSPDTAKANSDAIVHKGYELGIRYFDTAPLYGSGRSERYFASGFAGVDRDSYSGRLLRRCERSPANVKHLESKSMK